MPLKNSKCFVFRGKLPDISLLTCIKLLKSAFWLLIFEHQIHIYILISSCRSSVCLSFTSTIFLLSKRLQIIFFQLSNHCCRKLTKTFIKLYIALFCHTPRNVESIGIFFIRIILIKLSLFCLIVIVEIIKRRPMMLCSERVNSVCTKLGNANVGKCSHQKFPKWRTLQSVSGIATVRVNSP